MTADTRRLSAIVFDLEIVNAIPDRGKPRLPGIVYCDGWGDYANMGVAVIAAYDYLDQTMKVFLSHEAPAFATLVAGRSVVCGFNIIQFDNQVLRHSAGVHIPPERCFDILAAVKERVGRYQKGYSLDAICRANIDGSKSGDAAMAPIMWQRGQQDEVIEYCKNDVLLTKGLFDRILSGAGIVDPVNHATHLIPPPSALI